jgi:hypothetical protein
MDVALLTTRPLASAAGGGAGDAGTWVSLGRGIREVVAHAASMSDAAPASSALASVKAR